MMRSVFYDLSKSNAGKTAHHNDKPNNDTFNP